MVIKAHIDDDTHLQLFTIVEIIFVSLRWTVVRQSWTVLENVPIRPFSTKVQCKHYELFISLIWHLMVLLFSSTQCLVQLMSKSSLMRHSNTSLMTCILYCLQPSLDFSCNPLYYNVKLAPLCLISQPKYEWYLPIQICQSTDALQMSWYFIYVW